MNLFSYFKCTTHSKLQWPLSFLVYGCDKHYSNKDIVVDYVSTGLPPLLIMIISYDNFIGLMNKQKIDILIAQF
jgi:hypothetical protein